MVTTESVTIKVPVGMSKYLVTMTPETELTRNALLLYPYILNQTISHGRAAEILGIRKSELIVLESGRIDHSESDRNSQFELNRNSQCTLVN